MIQLTPIGYVRSSRKDVEDDNWGGTVSDIVVELGAESLQGIEDFWHAEVIFYFDKVNEGRIVSGARHPCNHPNWPKVGILAQRGRNRPNRLGLTTVSVLSREGNALLVKGLDAVDGTPVLDIKPMMEEFLPRGEIRQPEWVSELLNEYWNEKGG